MIEINKIRIESSLKAIHLDKYDAFFYGNDLDERTELAIKNISIEPRHKIFFDRENYNFNIDNDVYSLFDVHSFLQEKDYKYVLIDSTSLDFPEILYILFAIDKCARKINSTILYIEPEEYTNTLDDNQEEDYRLSDRMHPFSSLPIFAVNTQNAADRQTVLTSFLGFENSRLGQVLVNDDGASYRKLMACISVPAYNSGWENTSLKKHLRYFEYINSELKLYPGSNPYAVCELLDELHSEHNKLIITSLGTKPTAIGISIFLINNIRKNTIDKYVGAIYDFPVKSKGRSKGIGAIHTYEIYKA